MNDHRYNNQDMLDNWLKEAAFLPATDGIDQPAHAVWEGIRNARAAERRRKRFLLWWWIIGAGLVLGGIVLLFLSEHGYTDRSKNKPIAGVQPEKRGVRSTPEIQNSFSLTFSDQPLKPAAKPILKAPRGKQKNTQPAGHFRAAIVLPQQALAALPAYKAYRPDNNSIACLPMRPSSLTRSHTAISTIIPSSWKVPVFFSAVVKKPVSAKQSFYTGAQTMVLFGDKQTRSVQAGWLAGYQINKNWSVESGLQYLRTSRLAQYDGRMRYRTGLARTPATPSQHQLESNGMEDIETQLGAVTLRYTLRKGLDSPLPDQEWVQLRVHTREQNSFWRFPVLLRYQAVVGRWYWGAAGGGGLNLPAGSTIEVESVDTPNDNIQSVRAVALGLRANPQTVLLHGELQLAAGLRFGKGWSAEIAPGMQLGSKQLYFRDSDRPKVLTAGLQCRFLYNFH
jgi:hypothetical protein